MTRCKCKHRVRYFYSKGALLVLVWVLLLSVVTCSLINIIGASLYSMSIQVNSWLTLIPFFVTSILAFVSGLLADVKFGKYPVIRVGFVLLFISTVFTCLCLLILETVPKAEDHIVLSSFVAITILAIIGITLCIVNILQLGLDQMPDASSSSITSFIAWFVFCGCFGYWFSDLLRKRVDKDCLEMFSVSDVNLTWSLLTVLCMSVILILDFIQSSKWLIIEPANAIESLKAMHRIVKFAVKHKTPLNRSALTYWEEEIPSRLDLGKIKYGGPFTTEEVEDVKTTARLTLVSFTIWFVLFATQLDSHINSIPSTLVNACSDEIVIRFTYGNSWCLLIGTFAYEFLVYPLVRNKIPTILKRIGISSVASTIVSLTCLSFVIAQNYISQWSKLIALKWTSAVLNSVIDGLIKQSLLTSALEFVYAQSPYKIRGLCVGFFTVLILSAVLASKAVNAFYQSVFVALSVKTGLCTVAFVLHCITANWYKGRVRDEEYATQRVVEEVYDRYLSQSVRGKVKTQLQW